MLMTENPMDVGTQPLDQIMADHGMTNHTLVAASGELITHKMVQRARKGRRLTKRTQDKVLRALNKASPERSYERQEIFTYTGT